MADFKIDVQDLILVSVEKRIKDYSNKKIDSCVGEACVPMGKIKEIAILNKTNTRFVLISEIQIGESRVSKIREVKKYVPINCVGEYNFEKVAQVLADNKYELFFSQEELNFGIDFSVLKQKNEVFVQAQFDRFIKEFNETKVADIKRKALQKSREIYLNF